MEGLGLALLPAWQVAPGNTAPPLSRAAHRTRVCGQKDIVLAQLCSGLASRRTRTRETFVWQVPLPLRKACLSVHRFTAGESPLTGTPVAAQAQTSAPAVLRVITPRVLGPALAPAKRPFLSGRLTGPAFPAGCTAVPARPRAPRSRARETQPGQPHRAHRCRAPSSFSAAHSIPATPGGRVPGTEL